MYWVRGTEGMLRKAFVVLDSGPCHHLQLFTPLPFFSMLQLLIWTFEELAAVTACYLCILFFLSILVLKKAARESESVLGYRNRQLQHLKNPQMKGYKSNVVIDKKHSNNDLTIQMWRLSTKNGLETL